jgi:hypothetical protein
MLSMVTSTAASQINDVLTVSALARQMAQKYNYACSRSRTSNIIQPNDPAIAQWPVPSAFTGVWIPKHIVLPDRDTNRGHGRTAYCTPWPQYV